MVRADQAAGHRAHQRSIHHCAPAAQQTSRRALAAPPADDRRTVPRRVRDRHRREPTPRRAGDGGHGHDDHDDATHRRVGDSHCPADHHRPTTAATATSTPAVAPATGDGRLTLAFTGDALWHSPLWQPSRTQLRRRQRRSGRQGLHADARPAASGRRRRRRRRVSPRDADRPRRPIHDAPALRRATRGRRGDRRRRVRPLLDGEQPQRRPRRRRDRSHRRRARSERPRAVREWPARRPRSHRGCSSPTASPSPTSPTRSATTACASRPVRSGGRR